MKTKAITDIELKMETIDESSFRYQALDAAKKFKINWIELAKYLYQIRTDKLFKEWGYISFDTYCTKEIGIKKQTAFKLLSSYYFLIREEPDFLQEDNLKTKGPSTLPHYEAVNILRRAKTNKNMNTSDYNRLKESVLQRASEPREVGKQFRSMLWAVKSVDPEKERRNRSIATIKRLITTFKTLKKEAELLKLLPEKLIKEAERVVFSIETKIGREASETL